EGLHGRRTAPSDQLLDGLWPDASVLLGTRDPPERLHPLEHPTVLRNPLPAGVITMKPGKSALLVFLVFALVAGASFVLARHVVGQEENRLLAERSAEAAAELSSSVSSIDAGLHSLGTLAPLPQAADVFPAAATPLVTGLVRTVALVAHKDSGFT